MAKKRFSRVESGRFAGITLVLIWLLLPAGMSGGEVRAESPPPDLVIRSAAEVDYPPFSIVDAAGRVDGFSNELLRAALGAMGREVTFRTGLWNDVRDWLARGEIDALPLVGRTPERESLFDFTFPYMSLHGAIVVRKGTVGIRNLTDLKGKQVAVMAGDNAEEFLRREDRGIDIIARPTFEAALQELAGGRYDAVFIQRLVALRLIQAHGITGLELTRFPVEEFRQEFCFAVSKGDSRTLALLNDGLSLVMADGTFRRLHAKWFAALELPSDRPVIIGGDYGYPPFEFLDDRGRPAGFIVELTQAIAREMDMDIQIRLGPWSETVQALVNGDIDAVQGMFYTDERSRTLDFSTPHMVSYYVSAVHKDHGHPPETMAGLAGRHLVVQAGDVMQDFLAKELPDARVSFLETQADVLQALSDGRYDCALVPRINALYLIDEKGLHNLTLGSRHFFAGDYAYAVKKGQTALTAQFSEGLKLLEQSGEYRRIYDKWLGVYQEDQMTVIRALRYLAMALIPLLLILVAVFLWSWTLRRQVTRKTQEVRESAERFHTFAELSPVGIVVSDEQENTLYVSPKFTDLFGYTLADMPSVNQWWDLACPDPELRENVRHKWRQVIEAAGKNHSEIQPMEYPFRCKDGTVREIEFRMATTGKINIVVFTDISDRKKHEKEQEKLQAQLVLAQKMESVGRLAGGVAHDFNNMLGVIIGYSEIGMLKAGPQDRFYEDFKEILKAAERSADITRQLLAFARKQAIQPQLMNLNKVVEGALTMLRRLIGEDIHLVWEPGADLKPVYMDGSQVDQILTNLLVNARDAIEGVGSITIETGHAVFDPAYCADHPGFKPGEFVMLAVSDDGCGMDKETLEKVFEPFFSTKSAGKGTGLGLATVYGIVKQNDGFINVYSEPGGGTTVRIYLPRHEGVTATAPLPDRAPVPQGRGETILIVEDEAAILVLGRKMLENLGYQVLEASGPDKALELAKDHAAEIDLLLTDVVMPQMNGRDLAKQIQRVCPGIRILFMSGYTANVIAHRGILDPDVNFIQKPFSKNALAVKVREILEGEAPLHL